MQFIWKAC